MFFALNYRCDGSFFLQKDFDELGIAIKVVPSQINPRIGAPIGRFAHWRNLWKTARETVRRCKPGDLAIGWCFDLGLALHLNALLSFKRIHVIAHNFIFSPPPPRSLVRGLKRRLLGSCFRSGRFSATVNSPLQVETYSHYFKVDKDCFAVVHDSFDFQLDSFDFEPGDLSVFCGGMNYRDWDTYLECARQAPDISFVGVANRSLFATPTDSLPGNLRMYFDISESEFYAKMQQSSVVCLPLNTDAPAGLIVLTRAGQYRKPVVTTHTGPTSEFIDDRRSGFLCPQGDAPAMVAVLRQLIEQRTLRQQISENAIQKLRQFSPPECAKAFSNVITRQTARLKANHLEVSP